MKLKSIIFSSMLFISALSVIEIPLYKTPNAYGDLKKEDASIEDIDATHFLTDLNLGTPLRKYPLQVETSTHKIYVINDKFQPKKESLSAKTSQSFRAEPMENGEFNCPAKDKFLINDKNIILEFSSTERIFEQTLNEESSGILGLSVGDVNVQQRSKKFADQLAEKSIT